jgi:hypothetical protein
LGEIPSLLLISEKEKERKGAVLYENKVLWGDDRFLNLVGSIEDFSGEI